MRNGKIKAIAASFLLLFSISFALVGAEPNCDNVSSLTSGDFQYCIDKIGNEIAQLKPAHESNKKELSGLNTQLADLKKRITLLSSQLVSVEKDIVKREEDLEYANQIFNQKAKNHYEFIRTYDPLAPFLNSNASLAFREIVFRQRASDEDRITMEKYGQDLLKFKKDKELLQKNKTDMASLQKNLDGRAKFIGAEINKVESYITSLSVKQNELSALKAGGFAISVGETPSTSVPCSGPPGSANFCDPGFRPAFAGFSFGAPHRTGMSQYGAYGRAKSGQSAETILAAYYQGAELNKSYASPANITVSGIGTVSFEDNYMLGIYEVPESWGDNGGFEALKAQAVAARSYALYYTGNGAKSICTTESCQVYKPQLKSGKWAEAVRATKGWVMTKGGQAIGTYYASTSGGFTISQWGWSGIKDASGDWPATAYEKVAGSPWFYMGWYKSRAGASCSRSNPWLTSDDMADILNANKVLSGGGGDTSRISPTDTACWGGNPYSKEELKTIGGIGSVGGVSVVYSNSGYTQTLNFVTDIGNIGVSGEEFKKAFNLRAPGYVGLKSSLFNIEKL